MLLIVIEAPNKIDTVRKAARGVWGRDVEVFATGGYVKTFPSESIGINPSTFEPNADVYTKNGAYFRDGLSRVYKTYGLSGPWEKVFLMTDPDREGEGIAVQALQELRRWFPDVPTERVYAHELTSEGFIRSEHRPAPHPGMACAQKARRVLDRLLPLSASQYLGRGGDYRGLGRVQLASVNVLKKATASWKRFSLEGRWNTPDGPYYVKHTAANEAILQDQLRILKQVNAWENASKSVTTETVTPPLPLSAITLMSKLSDLRPEDTMAAAQNSYVLGRLSYPRTDQTILGAHGQRTVAALIDSLHLGARLQPGWHTQLFDIPAAGWVQGAHPALHPQHGWTPGEGLLDANMERVENEIAAAAMASMMIPATFRIHRAIINAHEDWFVATKTEVIEPGWTLAFTRLGLANPVMPTLTLGQRYPRIRESVPTPAHVVEWMSNAHLGRPSTLASVPTRLQSLGFLSGLCVPTHLATQTVSVVAKHMPRLAEPGFTVLMENGLAHLVDNPGDYQSVVKSLLVEAGADLIGLPTLVSNPDGFDTYGELDSAFESAGLD